MLLRYLHYTKSSFQKNSIQALGLNLPGIHKDIQDVLKGQNPKFMWAFYKNIVYIVFCLAETVTAVSAVFFAPAQACNSFAYCIPWSSFSLPSFFTFLIEVLSKDLRVLSVHSMSELNVIFDNKMISWRMSYFNINVLVWIRTIC